MKRKLITLMIVLLILSVFTGCSKKESAPAEDDYKIDYLVLVNKLNPLPSDWEDNLKTVHFTNTIGDDVEVEQRAYDAYLKMKEELNKEGVFVDLDSARRSVAAQQAIVDEFTVKYGADYTAKVVAKPGYSEHHTGLALDLYLIIDGVDVVENEDMVQYPEIWAKIHEKLDDYGFILRYLPEKEHITGYAYEPWHIRYVNDSKIAKEIQDKGLTLEGYLGAVKETAPVIDYGDSKLFTREQLEEVMIRIKCSFAAWEGCEVESLRYAGDEYSTQEQVDWANSQNPDGNYIGVVSVFSDYHKEDKKFKDYQWWLACNQEGDWDIVTSE